MRVEILGQPIWDHDRWLGYRLRSLLGNAGATRFDTLRILAAFAKTSGVSRIANALIAFRQHGGRISAIIGIDQRATSKQALRMLLDLTDELLVYHDRSPNRTFHPKLYLLAKPGRHATAIVGSGNLTGGGLFTNYEVMVLLDLDLSVLEELNIYNDLESLFAYYADETSGCTIRVTEEVMGRLEQAQPALLSDEETEVGEAPPTGEGLPVIAAREEVGESLFGTRALPPAPVPDLTLPRRPRSAVRARRPVQQGFWKVLSAFDVSPTSSPGQIRVPLGFARYFPSVRMTRGRDAGGRGRQWECSLRVLFRTPSGRLPADDARFIIYEPKTGHPRPNTEARFTFHSRTILNQLSAEDILVFRRRVQRPWWFEVTVVPYRSRRYHTYRVNTSIRSGTV